MAGLFRGCMFWMREGGNVGVQERQEVEGVVAAGSAWAGDGRRVGFYSELLLVGNGGGRGCSVGKGCAREA